MRYQEFHWFISGESEVTPLKSIGSVYIFVWILFLSSRSQIPWQKVGKTEFWISWGWALGLAAQNVGPSSETPGKVSVFWISSSTGETSLAQIGPECLKPGKGSTLVFSRYCCMVLSGTAFMSHSAVVDVVANVVIVDKAPTLSRHRGLDADKRPCLLFSHAKLTFSPRIEISSFLHWKHFGHPISARLTAVASPGTSQKQDVFTGKIQATFWTLIQIVPLQVVRCCIVASLVLSPLFETQKKKHLFHSSIVLDGLFGSAVLLKSGHFVSE